MKITNISYDAIILLAGSSSRFNDEINKVYVKVNDKPLFMHAFEKFNSDTECNHIILCYNENELDTLKSFVKESDKVIFVKGGSKRYLSVKNAVLASNSDYVLVHDGARANIKTTDIFSLKEALKSYDYASLCYKITDTIKKYDDKISNVSRDNLYGMLTPQASNRLILLKALNSVSDDDDITDDISALTMYTDAKGTLVLGDKNNIKVTTKEDLLYIKYLLGDKNV